MMFRSFVLLKRREKRDFLWRFRWIRSFATFRRSINSHNKHIIAFLVSSARQQLYKIQKWIETANIGARGETKSENRNKVSKGHAQKMLPLTIITFSVCGLVCLPLRPALVLFPLRYVNGPRKAKEKEKICSGRPCSRFGCGGEGARANAIKLRPTSPLPCLGFTLTLRQFAFRSVSLRFKPTLHSRRAARSKATELRAESPAVCEIPWKTNWPHTRECAVRLSQRFNDSPWFTSDEFSGQKSALHASTRLFFP